MFQSWKDNQQGADSDSEQGRERAGFPGGSAVKILPAVLETRARSLGREDPLEKVMATHSSILAWKIPWTEEPDGLPVHGIARVGPDLATKPPPPFNYNGFNI